MSKSKESPEEYRKRVEKHLAAIKDILGRGAVGDFWTPVKVPKKNDEFTELYVGIDLMMDVLRDKYASLEGLTQIEPRNRQLWQEND